MKATGDNNKDFPNQNIVCIIKPCKEDTDRNDIYITTTYDTITWARIWRNGNLGMIDADGRIFAHRLLCKAVILTDDANSEAIREAIRASVNTYLTGRIRNATLDRLKGFKLHFEI